ncbi:MAG: hypothetical protein WC876_00255 [Candidatus Thermoplasmatota archaeon]|jgi:hypothetical protein
MADDADALAVEPLGAPTDLVRPAGRMAEEAVAQSKARLAARGRKVLRALALGLAAAALLALFFFFVVSAFWPKPDL